MAAWPTLDELKQILDITSEDWDGDSDGTRLTRVLASAIDRIKAEVAGTVALFDEVYDEPTDSIAQAALRMAELIATRPDQTVPRPGQDPTIRRLLYGSRRVFGVA
jgi:hypothetical protein